MSALFKLLLSTLLTLLALAGTGSARPQGPATELPQGAALRVAGSVRLPAGVHVRAPREVEPGGVRAVIWATGVRNAVLELSGATLASAAQAEAQDSLTGFAVYLVDCENVTVRGGVIRGFKAGVVARNCRGVRIEQVRFERNFAQRLTSTAAAADRADELARDANENGEWLARYGAAIALDGCVDAVVAGCRARHGQNGLLLERCTGARVYDNDFSFLSGWGLALYRSSDNRIVRNRCDYCVRGYSHGAFASGQGAAGILLFERCSDNVIAHNSARYCGDGLSLHAGRDLVEGRAASRGERAASGCDRNLIYRNDFSHAVRCGAEFGFSRENRVVENVADHSLRDGLRGAYVERMLVVENSLSHAGGAGLSIEHGQECWIARNVLEHCGVGLELYWDEDPEYVGGPFGRSRDTASRDHWIWGNAFSGNTADLRVRATTGLRFRHNVFDPIEGDLVVSGLELAPGEAPGRAARELLRGVGEFLPTGSLVETTVRSVGDEPPADFAELERIEPGELPGRSTPAALEGRAARGADSIVLGEWGPWDFEGADPRPSPRPIGGWFAGRAWDVAWIAWKDGVDPRVSTREAWHERVREHASLRARVEGLSDPWAGRQDVLDTVGETHFGLVASTRLRVPKGRYLLRVTSDDGVRVRIGSKRVIDNWTWHTQTVDEALLELEDGEYEFTVDYFQVDGGAALSLDLLSR